jgi:hypothetical protein
MSPVIEVRRLMEEAERRCDRDGVKTERRIQFRPSVPLPQHLLASLPDVTSVIYRGDVVVATGNTNALNAVASALARNQIVARHDGRGGGGVRPGRRPVLPVGVNSAAEAADGPA